MASLLNLSFDLATGSGTFPASQNDAAISSHFYHQVENLCAPTQRCLYSRAFVCFCKLMTFLLFSDTVAAAEPVAQGLRKLPEAIEWSYSGPYFP